MDTIPLLRTKCGLIGSKSTSTTLTSHFFINTHRIQPYEPTTNSYVPFLGHILEMPLAVDPCGSRIPHIEHYTLIVIPIPPLPVVNSLHTSIPPSLRIRSVYSALTVIRP